MLWWWKVRIHDKAGNYWHGQFSTGRNLKEIENIQEAYWMLTSCKMLLEGMSECEFEDTVRLQDAFDSLWLQRLPLVKTRGNT